MEKAAPLHYLSLAEISRQIRERKVSAVGVTQSILNRIDAIAPRHQSFVTVLADRSLKKAAAARPHAFVFGDRHRASRKSRRHHSRQGENRRRRLDGTSFQ
jgi:Asp-tRNA(Asn)/Glu-tRNA(Gln) amidotransferase A subunit family amidase